jgi:hypothetical protein
MNEPDIVAELDEWLADPYPTHWQPMIQCARDEIVALRENVHIKPLELIAAKARAEALEEAAALCERVADHGFPDNEGVRRRLARSIRLLKDKPHE